MNHPPASPPVEARLEAYVLTGPGKEHDHNEDAVLALQEVLTGQVGRNVQHQAGAWCLGVFDGMGGHHGGEVASRDAAGFLSVGRDWSLEGTQRVLREANRRLFERACADPSLHAMGATTAGLVFGPDGLLVFNVGDARVYRFNGGFLQPLTEDDSLHQVLVSAGQSSGERGATQHTILQSLGGRSEFTEIEPHVNPVRLRGSTRFLICSDGITDMLDADALEAAVNNRASCEECARALYEAALAAGGKDNLSVIVADIQPLIISS
jgi:protein phosphatase